MLDRYGLSHVAKVRVGHKFRREDIGSAGREIVRASSTCPWVSAPDRHALQLITVDRFIERPEIQLTVAAEDIQLRRGIPVHLRIKCPAVEIERRLDEVVV